jgi:hypothetical protein
VQIALALDSSNSMDGLIEQARDQLWRVVNEALAARKKGEGAVVEVALIEYGNSGLFAESGYIKVHVGLTRDLDQIAEALFAISTNGGDEYCGATIDKAMALAWSPRNDVYKAMFIAGNEPFDQGTKPFREACRAAIRRGVVINTIFCGPLQTGVDTHWKEGADLADGAYMAIDQNQSIAHIEAPQDKRIMELSQEHAKTFMYFGKKREERKNKVAKLDRQTAEAAAPAAQVERAIAKSAKQYKEQVEDLVSAVEDGRVELDDVEEEELPEPLRDLEAPARKKVLAETSAKRQELEGEMKRLQAERDRFLAEKRAGASTLDQALVEALRGQMTKKKFEWPANDGA